MYKVAKASDVYRLIYIIFGVVIATSTLVTFVLTLSTFGRISVYGSCTFDNCFSDDNCTTAVCNSGVCIKTQIEGCSSTPNSSATSHGTYEFRSLFVTNITSTNQNNSLNTPIYIEGVQFQNNTVTFDCLISQANCPNIFSEITFEQAVYINSIIQYNTSYVFLNNAARISQSGVLDIIESVLNIKSVNSSNICSTEFTSCGNSSNIAGITVTNGTVNIDIATVGSTAFANNLILNIQNPYNLTFFTLSNSTAQAHRSEGSYGYTFFSGSSQKTGVGYNDRNLLNYTLSVNGTLAGPGLDTFGNRESKYVLSTFEYYLFNTTIYGPWALNYSRNFVISQEGNMVTFEFPSEFNDTAIVNSSIRTLRPIPSRFLPNFNVSQTINLDIVVTADASYNGLPGIFQLAADGYFSIYPLLPTNATTTPYSVGERALFAIGNPAGIKYCSVSWVKPFNDVQMA